MEKGRPNSWLARAKSACCNTCRTNVLLTRSPSTSNVSVSCTVKSWTAPISESILKSPLRSQPKRKSSPTIRCAAPSPSTSTNFTNSAAVNLLSAGLKCRQSTWSKPNSNSASTLSRRRINLAGAFSPEKNSWGWGSKVMATAGKPSSAARSLTCLRIA